MWVVRQLSRIEGGSDATFGWVASKPCGAQLGTYWSMSSFVFVDAYALPDSNDSISKGAI